MNDLKTFLLEDVIDDNRDILNDNFSYKNGFNRIDFIWGDILSHKKIKKDETLNSPLISCPPAACEYRFSNAAEIWLSMLYANVICDICDTQLHKTPVGEYTLSEIIHTFMDIRKEQKKLAHELRKMNVPKDDRNKRRISRADKRQFLAKAFINGLFSYIITHEGFDVTGNDIVDEAKGRMVDLYQFLSDNGYMVFYIDTDSMFVADGDVGVLDKILQNFPHKTYVESMDICLAKFKRWVIGGRSSGFIAWEGDQNRTTRIERHVNNDIINQLRGEKVKV